MSLPFDELVARLRQNTPQHRMNAVLTAYLKPWNVRSADDARRCRALVAAGAVLTPDTVYALGNWVQDTSEPLRALDALLSCVPLNYLFGWEPTWLRGASAEVLAAALAKLNALNTDLAAVVGSEGIVKALHAFLENDKLDCCILLLEGGQGRLPYADHQTDAVVHGLRIAMGFLDDGGGLEEEEGEGAQSRLHWFLCGAGDELRPELQCFMPTALLQRVEVEDPAFDVDYMSPLELASNWASPCALLRKLLKVCWPFCGDALVPVLEHRLSDAEANEDGEDMATALREVLSGGGLE